LRFLGRPEFGPVWIGAEIEEDSIGREGGQLRGIKPDGHELKAWLFRGAPSPCKAQKRSLTRLIVRISETKDF
jgi:hypothetical protein